MHALRAHRILLIGTSCAMLSASARAQEMQHSLAQLAHRAWTARDGAPAGNRALAQTRDGFLWLGGTSGLFRFDGVRFERYEGPPGYPLPSNGIDQLRATPDGALWIGYTLGGASVMTNGRLVNYDARDGYPGGNTNAIVLDSAGTPWVATTRGLATLIGSRWRAVGPERGYPGGFTADLTVDRRGALWASATSGVYVLPRGAQRFSLRAPPLAVGEPEVGSGRLRSAPDGSVWAVSISRGLERLTDTAGHPLSPTVYDNRDRGAAFGWWELFIDRQSYAWGLGTHKLVRVALRANDVEASGFPARDTLALAPGSVVSGATALAVLEDREGTIWVGTDGGLDQFRVPKVSSIAVQHGAFGSASPIIAADSGGVWVGGYNATFVRVSDDGSVAKAPAPAPTWITTGIRDLSGNLWVGGLSGLWRGDRGRFEPVALPTELRGAILRAIARDLDGDVWILADRRGVFRRRGTKWTRHSSSDPIALALVADSVGRTWRGYVDGHLIRNGQGPETRYDAGDGLRVGGIMALATQGRRVWAGGDLGVAVMNERSPRTAHSRTNRPAFTTLTLADGVLRGVTSIVATARDLWIYHADGVARLDSAEIEHALSDSTYHVRVERFDARDRVDASAALGFVSTMVRGTDERIWFSWLTGVGWIDPAHIRRNLVPPPVVVRAVLAGGKTHTTADSITLPQRTRALSIAYTALSLAVPERVTFRYRFVGLDTAWQDAGTRREAYFTNLTPGAYRFEVIAANDDGVWSASPAAVDILIPAAFVQTNAFRALCALAATGALWLLVLWRQRRVAEAIRARFEGTLAERTRVARELHDTLLTDVAGIRMRLDAVARAAGPAGFGADIADIRDAASHTLLNARRAVVEMRAENAGSVDDQLTEASRRIFGGIGVNARVSRTGTPFRFAQAVEAEAIRIGVEALTNARNHAACSTVLLSCAFSRRALRVEVRDDGRGFDANQAAANGHFGLVGMRERAAAIGAQLSVESTPGRGTTVVLIIPRHAVD